MTQIPVVSADAGPHGDTNGNDTLAAIGAVMLGVVLLVTLLWMAWTAHRNETNRKD